MSVEEAAFPGDGSAAGRASRAAVLLVRALQGWLSGKSETFFTPDGCADSQIAPRSLKLMEGPFGGSKGPNLRRYNFVGLDLFLDLWFGLSSLSTSVFTASAQKTAPLFAAHRIEIEKDQEKSLNISIPCRIVISFVFSLTAL